jgi:hypothetical protein
MPFFDVVVSGVAQSTKTYHIEAENEEEAEANYSHGDCISENYEDDKFTEEVESVTPSK